MDIVASRRSSRRQGHVTALRRSRSGYLLENLPSMSLHPLVLVIHDSRFRSRSLCSVGPTVRHGFLAPSSGNIACLSIATAAGSWCGGSMDDREMIAAMRRHILIPFFEVNHGRRQVRLLLVVHQDYPRGWRECSAVCDSKDTLAEGESSVHALSIFPRGRRIRNVVPAESEDWISIFPSCACTIRSAM